MFKRFHIIALLVIFAAPAAFAQEGEMSFKATKGRSNACLGKSIASLKYSSLANKTDKKVKDAKTSIAN